MIYMTCYISTCTLFAIIEAVEEQRCLKVRSSDLTLPVIYVTFLCRTCPSTKFAGLSYRFGGLPITIQVRSLKRWFKSMKLERLSFFQTLPL